MADSAAKLLKREEALLAIQANCRVLWQDVADYVIPSKGNITVLRVEGQKQTDRLFDSTAPHALVLLAASLHTTMTPATQPWLSLKMRQSALNEIKEVRDWLEDCARRMHAAFRQSVFNQSVHELYFDLAGFGTACLLVEEKDPQARGEFGGFRFYVPAVGTYAIAEDAEGQVDTVFRRLQMSRRAAFGKWGKKIGAQDVSLLESKPDDNVTILHAVYPRSDRVYGDDNKAKRGSANMPIASCYVMVNTKHKIEEGGYEEFPYCVPRWAKTSGEIYGRGPSHTALPDVASLNAAKEFILKSAPLKMWPPTLERDDAVVGPLDTQPHGRNVVNGAGAVGDQLQFMDTKQDIQMEQLILAELRQGIHAIYFTDQLILREKPDMTATEVMALQEQMNRLLGPTTGRLESEFLNPLVQRCFAIMARAGAFLPLPEALREGAAQQSNAADLDIEYEGPLARAQRSVELAAQDRVINLALTLSTQLVQVAPDLARQIWDNLDLDKMIQQRAEITGLRSDNLTGDETMKAMREQRAQQQAEQAKMDNMVKASEGVKNITPLAQAMQPQNGQTKAAA